LPLELTAQGLITETQAAIVARLAARLRAVFGVNLRATDAKAIAGQLVLIMAEEFANDQQALLAVYRSFDPNGAFGTALAARVGLTGTVPQGETHSFVEGLLTFTGAGSFPLNGFIRNVDNDTLWKCTSGPHVAVGAGTIAAQFTAVDAGPILAQAGTTWSNVTVVPGLASPGFSNPTDDAEPGRDREEDGPIRTRRLIEMFSKGQGPLAAIQSVVSKVAGVLLCRVYHNPSTFPVDSDGIPFKAVNVVVETDPPTPDADLKAAIFNAIWTALGGGGQAFGTSYSGTIIDSEGSIQPVAFDVVQTVNVVLEVDLITSTTTDPITPNLETIVADQILAIAQANYEKVGRSLTRLDITGIVYDMLKVGPNGEAPLISGVDGVDVRMALDPGSPSAVAKLNISKRQRPDFDSGNLSVAQV
jgi:hypothetical protein